MIGNGIFVLSDKEKIDLNLCNLEKDYLKPFYKNSDINKWFSEDRNTRWLLYTNGIDDINDFPNIKSHLLRNKQILDNRYRNYALQKADRERRWWVLYGYRPNTDFESEKIICPYRSFSNIFAYSDKPFYASIDVFYLFIEDPHYDLYYILGILNSKLILYWLKKKGKMKGKIIELVKKPLSKIPIKIQSGKEQETISSIVNQIIQIKKDNEDDKIPPLECNLNDIIFDLYKVDSKDRKQIENNINKGE